LVRANLAVVVSEPRGKALDDAVEGVLRAADAYLAGEASVQKAAEAIARRFREMGIDYAIAGALALAVHGFVRLTVDVDVLVRREDLARFKKEWLGRGYVEVFAGSKAVRDSEHDVKIDFLVTGEYPGDGKPKPVSFADPRDARIAGDRFDAVSLPVLIEMKIASGMTAPHRGHDLADVQRLVRAARLPREFAEQLDPYVRAKFDELWQLAQHPEEDY
jgi:hypothetical protein